MTSYLGRPSVKAGVGLQGRTRDALIADLPSSKTAHHLLINSGVAHPGVNKRESKTLKKQTFPFIDEDHYDQLKQLKSPQLSDAQHDEQQPEQTEEADRQQFRNVRKRRSDYQGVIRTIGSDFSNSSSSEFDEQSLKLDAQYKSNDLLTAQSSYEPMKFRKLSEEEEQSPISFVKKTSVQSSSAKSCATSSNDTIDHGSLIAKAYSLWEALNGRLLSEQVLSGRGGNDGLQFECTNKHQFIISLSSMHKLKSVSIQNSACHEIWCLKCRNFLRKAEEKASSMNSTIVSSCITQGFVAVKCQHNHQFDLKFTRNFAKTWCEQCKSDTILKQKEQYRQNEQSEELRKQAEQKRLFEESQRYMEQQQQQSQAFSQQQEYNYFNAVLNQVCGYAKTKMERYMSQPAFKGECSHMEIYNVYKIVYMPFEVLVKTLSMIEKSQLNKHYRKLALILHPDKNKHEQASEAFKKLTQAFEVFK